MRIVNSKVLLTANEVATAIDAYLVARGVAVIGPRTIALVIDGEDRLVVPAVVIVDPSGKIVDNR